MLAVLVALSLLIPSLEAQIGGLPERGGAFRPGTRRDPGPPAPKLADGTVNLGRVEKGKGAWLPGQVQDYSKILKDPAKGIPYMPWSKALKDYRKDVTESAEDPQGFCIPPGGPRLQTTMFPMEIIQLPGQDRIIQILQGGGHIWREIFLDGRPHPESFDGLDASPTFMGHSVGRWEGDMLVVDTIGFNEGTWLDMDGHPHTDQMHLIERYSRPGINVLRYEATIDDPAAYTEPWTMALDIPWGANSSITEYICQENNRYQDNYVKHTKGLTGTGNSGADSGHGHPVKGTFNGQWGASANSQEAILMLLDWDGKAITGTINPGPDAIAITKADMNVTNWTITIEAGTGANRVVMNGKFENLTWLARSITGTYTRGNQKGTFKITRQY